MAPSFANSFLTISINVEVRIKLSMKKNFNFFCICSLFIFSLLQVSLSIYKILYIDVQNHGNIHPFVNCLKIHMTGQKHFCHWINHANWKTNGKLALPYCWNNPIFFTVNTFIWPFKPTTFYQSSSSCMTWKEHLILCMSRWNLNKILSLWKNLGTQYNKRKDQAHIFISIRLVFLCLTISINLISSYIIEQSKTFDNTFLTLNKGKQSYFP